MKRFLFITLSFFLVFMSGFTLIENNLMPNKGITFTKGNNKIFTGKKSFLVEFDFSKASVDGLDTEEEYIEYKMSKKKTKEAAKKWKNAWYNDKKSFAVKYEQALSSYTKKTALSFNIDDPKSDYKMLVTPIHVETGNGIKKSAVELRITITEMGTDKEVATLHVPRLNGVQQSPGAPTTGMRVQYALVVSAKELGKYIKKIK